MLEFQLLPLEVELSNVAGIDTCSLRLASTAGVPEPGAGNDFLGTTLLELVLHPMDVFLLTWLHWDQTALFTVLHASNPEDENEIQVIVTFT